MKIIGRHEGLSRSQLMDFGFVTGDHNPIHFDRELVKRRGFPKPLVHGMYLYCLVHKSIDDFLKAQAPHLTVLDLSSKFSGMTFENEAFVVAINLEDGATLVADKSYKVFLKNDSEEIHCSFVVTLKPVEAPELQA